MAIENRGEKVGTSERKIAKRLPYSAYELWMQGEGVPIYEGYQIDDIAAVERGEWGRLGGNGAFFNLRGMDGVTLAYVIDIAPGEELNWQKHMYEESIFVLDGTGVMEMETPLGPERSCTYSWKKGTLLAPTLNARYQLRNTSNETALLYVVTDAPIIMDLYHNVDFVFNSDFVFEDRMEDISADNEVKTSISGRGGMVMSGNQIHDVDRLSLLDHGAEGGMGSGVTNSVYEMAGNTLAGHLAQDPLLQYDRAHYHNGGAVLLCLKSDMNVDSHGYTLLWPPELGQRPYQNGYGDQVVRIDWKPGSIFSPPTSWYHAHFNLAKSDAVTRIAFRFGYGCVYPARFYTGTHDVNGRTACTVPSHRGGTMIDWPDEDPQIHEDFEAAVEAEGGKCGMDHSLFKRSQ